MVNASLDDGISGFLMIKPGNDPAADPSVLLLSELVALPSVTPDDAG